MLRVRSERKCNVQYEKRAKIILQILSGLRNIVQTVSKVSIALKFEDIEIFEVGGNIHVYIPTGQSLALLSLF